MLCCPVCRGPLAGEREHLRCAACATAFGALGGVPVLVAEADLKSIDLRADAEALPSHDCAHVGIAAIDAALARDDRILELGAGCGANGAPNIVRTDAFVWRSSSSPGAVDAGHPSAAQRPAPGSLSATGRGDALA